LLVVQQRDERLTFDLAAWLESEHLVFGRLMEVHRHEAHALWAEVALRSHDVAGPTNLFGGQWFEGVCQTNGFLNSRHLCSSLLAATASTPG
jgi:hypothetical protein